MGLYERFVQDLSQRVASAAAIQTRAIAYRAVDRSKSDAHDPVVDALEWEPLSHPLTINVTRLGDHRGHLGVVTFQRGEQYQVAASFHCASGELAYSLVGGTPGEFDEGVPLEGVDEHGNLVRVPHVFFCDIEHVVDGSGSQIVLEAHLRSLERTFEEDKPTTVVDWFISGPRDRGAFACRRTERIRHESYERHRLGRPRGQP